MTNNLNDKLETANGKIIALQHELREMQKNSSTELTSLRVALQEAQKIAQTAEEKIKKAKEDARNSKERAKRFKRRIERLLEVKNM